MKRRFVLALLLLTVRAFGQGCTSTATIPPPAIAPFAGLIGAGAFVANPEPANFLSFGCFGSNNPMLRVSDGNTPPAACTAQGGSCASKANQSMFVNSGDGEDFQWSVDESQFVTLDSGSTFYVWDFHGITLPATVRYTNNPNHVLKMWSFPTASHVTPKLWYSLANAAGTADGTVLSSYDTSKNWPTLPTRTTVYDFASSVNGVPVGATKTDPIAANYTDTKFGTGFSTLPGQGTGVYVASYLVGSGVSVWNTLTGTVTGDYGGTGAVVCQNCPGGAPNPGQFKIHNVKWNHDLTYATVAVQDGTCVGTCYNKTDPYLWQAGTTKVWVLCLDGSGRCSGHNVTGQLTFNNQYSTPYFIQKPLPGNTGTTFPNSPDCSASAFPIMDQHASWWNDNLTDTQPFFVSTTASGPMGSTNPVYNACNVSEIDGIDPPTIGDNKIFRVAHNFGYSTSEFAVQNQLMTISPSGKYALFTSPMGNSSNVGQLGDTSGNYPCVVAANCRGDIFIVQLGGLATLAPSPLFGFTENNTASNNFPTVSYGMQRFWDSPPLQWPSLNTALNTFNFSALDTVLAQSYAAGEREAMYTLARTPPWATSQPLDTTCHYQSPAVGGGHGECFPPSDLNADGSGTNAIWKAWITKIAQHANGQDSNPTYLSNHAHIRYWEIWNEPDAAFFWSGSFAQLARLTEDANCIITGRGVIHQNGDGTATACTATAIDPTAQIIMASGHADSANNRKYAQNQLYCNNTSGVPAFQLPCPSPANATAAAIDIVNFHMKPGNAYPASLEVTFGNYITNINAILQSPETTKPLWDGEAAYAELGFPAPYNDPDMAASVFPRLYLTMWTQGISGSAWYTWDNIKAQASKVQASYQQTYNYLVGASLTTPCAPSGTVYSCTITKNGVSYLILWDNAQTCSGGSCTTGNVSVPAQWITYQDMTSTPSPIAISGHVVPVGIKPVLLQAGTVVFNPPGPAPQAFAMNN